MQTVINCLGWMTLGLPILIVISAFVGHVIKQAAPPEVPEFSAWRIVEDENGLLSSVAVDLVER